MMVEQNQHVIVSTFFLNKSHILVGLPCYNFFITNSRIIIHYLLPYTYIRVAFNTFPGFFVPAYTIIVDSWKFIMSLLYII